MALDPAGRGVKKSAILENPIAHEYYEKHSTSYQLVQKRRRQTTRRSQQTTQPASPLRIDPERDVARVRYRYLQRTKPEIVERLLIVEQAYAESQQQMAKLQFELLDMQQKQVEEKQQQRTVRRKRQENAEREDLHGKSRTS